MAELSVIVPTYFEASGVEAFLAVTAQRLQGIPHEFIVVDASDDATAELASAFGARVIKSEAGRARQMNAGAAVARGEYLMFLHCDTYLPRYILSWWNHLKAEQAAWGFFYLRLSGTRRVFRVIERAICLRSKWTSVSTGDQVQFVRSDVWRALGGFNTVPIMEDVELSKRLRRIERPLIWKRPVITSSRRWQECGVARTVLLMWGLRLAYWLGVAPERLASFYRARRNGFF